MLKIGEFSKLSRVSVRMLRHYDELGLLAPSEVDPMTGYRYYSERQLIAAGRIAALRALGFGLSETRELLRIYDDRTAPMFNIYHVSPHETQTPDESVTEVCFPVREAESVFRRCSP
ncbi:MAG: MerR family transcriptional regulator [Oscillospiraceae bacterium]